MADIISTLFGVPVEKTGPGPHILIPGETDKGFRLFRIVLTFIVPTAPYVTVRLRSINAANELSGGYALHVGDLGALSLGMEQRRWFMTNAAGSGVALVIEGDSDVKIAGFLTAEKFDWPLT